MKIKEKKKKLAVEQKKKKDELKAGKTLGVSLHWKLAVVGVS